jgi:predicted dehydrogenase/nucleoside-diphosphate-sugar epimerase
VNPLRIGIIGCGAAAKRYYVPALKQHPALIHHLCLVDNNREQAQELADQIGGGQVFTDHQAIIGKIDGVIIALPHFLHFPIAMDFLEAGIHVLCEKPLAETSEQAEKMAKAASEKNVHLCVNNTRRMFPAFQSVKKIIDSGRIGKLISIRYTEGNSFAWPSATGFYVDPSVTDRGVLLDLGPHVLDTICWWLGGENPKVLSCQDDSFGGPESVMRLSAEMGGCRIDVLLNRLLELENTYVVTGEKGQITGKIFDWCNCTVETYNGEKEQVLTKTPAKTYPDFVIPVIDNFIEAIRGKADPLVPGREVISSISMIEEAYQIRKTFNLPWYAKINLPSLPDDGIILVTGATGFIGCRIVELLHLSGVSNVRAAIKQWSSAARLGRFPVDTVIMDLLNREEISRALDGVKYIVHCAKGTGGATDIGTRNILEAALEKGVKHFVHLSTTEVYGIVERKIDENTPYQYTGNEYNKTKIDAEKACWEFYEKGLPVTVLRPSIVYGLFSNNWTVHFARMFIEGKWGIYEKYGEGLCNLIHVDDLAQTVFRILNNSKSMGQAFNIVGPEIVTWNEYFRRFNDKLGLPPLKTIHPAQAGLKTTAMKPVRVAGKIVKNHFMAPVKKLASTFAWADKLLRKTEKTLKTTPSTDELKLFSRKALYSDNKIKDLIQINDAKTLDIGMSLTCEWLAHQGILKYSK